MISGRPRTSSLSTEEMIQLGQEMVEWCIENKPLHLSEWYTIKKMFTYNQWKSFIQKKEFIPYYEKALKLVGIQYLDKESRIRDGISQRWQRVYFKDLKEKEDKDKKSDLERICKIKAKYQTQQDVPLESEKLNLEAKIMELEARLAKYEPHNES